MTTDLHWIPGPWPGRLAIANRPRGGDWLADETLGLSNAGVKVLVSLLEPEEERDLELLEEGNVAKAAGIEFRLLSNTRSGYTWIRAPSRRRSCRT
jgi:hypothetical protein